MATTDLKLEERGTLPKPGPIGRLVRLGLGLLCLYYVYGLWLVRGDLMTDTGSIRPLLWNGVIFGLFLVSYVVNIGFSRDWKKWPAIISAIILFAVGGIGYLQSGSIETPLLAQAILVWELYVFMHLGVSFVVAAMVRTPGCEMRAFHHLYSLATGNPTKEHHCPVGPLQPIDNWEAKRSWMTNIY